MLPLSSMMLPVSTVLVLSCVALWLAYAAFDALRRRRSPWFVLAIVALSLTLGEIAQAAPSGNGTTCAPGAAQTGAPRRTRWYPGKRLFGRR